MKVLHMVDKDIVKESSDLQQLVSSVVVESKCKYIPHGSDFTQISVNPETAKELNIDNSSFEEIRTNPLYTEPMVFDAEMEKNKILIKHVLHVPFEEGTEIDYPTLISLRQQENEGAQALNITINLI